MERQLLVAALAGCMNPDPQIRIAAEHALQQAKFAPGQLHGLLQVALDGAQDPAVQQAAAIAFKNGVKQGWDAEEGSRFSAEERAAVRAALPEALVVAGAATKRQLREAVKLVVYTDYPHAWPGLLGELCVGLKSLDQARVEGTLSILRVVARKYEFKDEEDRLPLLEVVNSTFPALLALFQSLLASDSGAPELAELLKLVCKIFWSSTYMEIPPPLASGEAVAAWMACIRGVIERPVPLELMPADPELRDDWAWWKAKKWALHIAYRAFNRYGSPDLCTEPADVAFASAFKRDWALPLLQACLGQLAGLAQGRYLAGRACNLILQYLTQALAFAHTWKALKPVLAELLPAVIFPMLCFTAADDELWREDPAEFVRKGYDIVEDLHSSKTAAMNFLLELCKARPKGTLDATVQHMVGQLVAYRAAGDAAAGPEAVRRADGACLALGTLAEVLKQKERYAAALEPMLLQHVVPLFASRHGHLRAKAAWLAGCFADVRFADGQGRGATFAALLQRCVAALEDPDLPVKVDAAVAVRCFLDAVDEEDLGDFRGLVPGLLTRFLQLSQEIDNEDLTFSLETVVERFAGDMAPYAAGLTAHLVEQFWRIVREEEEQGEGEDEEAEGALAAYGVLRTLSTILDAVSSRAPELYPQLEAALLPLLERYISTDGQDVFEELMQIVTYLTYYGGGISARLWGLFPRILACLDEWAPGHGTFLATKHPADLLALTNRSIERALTGDGYPVDQVACAARLAGVVLQHCRGRVDACVAPYVTLVLRALVGSEDEELTCSLLLLAADLLYYDAALTLRAAEPAALGPLFVALTRAIEARQRRDDPGARSASSVLGLAAVLALPEGAAPAEVAAGAPQLVRAAVRLLVAIKGQEERLEARAAAAREDEDFDPARHAPADAAARPPEEEESDEDEDRLRRRLGEDWSDDEDDEGSDWWSDEEEAEIQSPIDAVDPFVFFADAMGALGAASPARLQAVMGALEPALQAAVQGMSAYAAQLKLEQAAAGQPQG
ncbi:hypothetical protein QBZ16_002302 [Prototheca wickerhamii]|uniref:Importin N-terminal domain-containing protein n=1 Tax=Prototheca wickerhamii TaxID=3111 RepID=A0AAD9MJH9_PROWI|nr:hypothetical protein QBZ16_002302 [Prototheca wickerhamii]